MIVTLNSSIVGTVHIIEVESSAEPAVVENEMLSTNWLVSRGAIHGTKVL